MPFWALSITFIASWWGAGSAISTADLAFSDGMGAFWYYGVPVLISTLLMIIGAKTIRRVGYLTQGEMMQARYSKATSKILSVMILIFMTLNAASQMVGIGDFFGTYIGMDYEMAVILGSSIVLIYSMFGGFRGVVLTDIIQFILLLFSAIIVFAVAMKYSGGFTAIKETAENIGKPDFMDLSAGISKYIGYVVTFGCAWMIQANVWQRISATKNDVDARKMTIMSFIVYIPLYLIVVFTGMAGITMFDTMPKGGIITNLVMNYMPPILGALVFVGISAAIMSTMDSLINTGAMTFSLDLFPDRGNDKYKLKVSRIATLAITLIAMGISLVIRSILEIAWIASDIITTGVFIPLLAGFVWKRGNSHGAMASMITGLIYCSYNLIISFGINLPSFWEPHSATQVLIGIILSTLTYTCTSLLTKPEYNKAKSFISASKKIKE